ncbi:hypothetical protein A0H81_02308 [Grifola frondosa]|uniref:Uncharacterized protein n=1 Tax=Grifola frondosa TaxID=5627 RepID=A0A1C7MMC5_GRIFR|nr:hypothetical protein A0H81_02308 [Grifola frondosa]
MARTQGLRVYRHKGKYRIIHNNAGSYPENLGVQILNGIPRDPQWFREWLEASRAQFDSRLLEWEARSDEERKNATDDWISSEQPDNTDVIKWIYEIDLDNLVFHVDSYPMFRLDHMPPEDTFIDGIAFDNYGHRACAGDTPEEYRYNWTALPPVVHEDALDTYRRHAHKATSVPIHHLLAVPEDLSNKEAVRTRLLELFSGNLICKFGRHLRILETVAGYENMSQETFLVATTFIVAAMYPLPLVTDLRIDMPNTDLWWPRRNVCVGIFTHLNHERNLQAAISKLVAQIIANPHKTGIVYAVAFSVFHIVIVRVDKDTGGSFRHTPALTFLPSFHGTSPSTPGITALARLIEAAGLDLQTLLQAYPNYTTDRAHTSPVTLSPISGRLAHLPPELLSNIAEHLFDPEDLMAFGSTSESAMRAVYPFVARPYLHRYPLLSVEPMPPYAAPEDASAEHCDCNMNGARFGIALPWGPAVLAVNVPYKDESAFSHMAVVGHHRLSLMFDPPQGLDREDFSIQMCLLATMECSAELSDELALSACDVVMDYSSDESMSSV